nr:sigma-70 family RNA polymerase sigma factor [Kofleriaceae bacterium]
MSDSASVELEIRASCEAARWSEAATTALETYGDELLGYLVAVTRNEADAADAFSQLAESLWTGLPAFRWDSSLRTWAYTLARSALHRQRRDPRRRRAVPLDDAAVDAIAASVRSRTATFLRTETRDKIARIRATLDPDDQTLLILRINRRMAWRDVARVLGDSDDDPDKLASSLRKRFERLKAELKSRAAEP